MKRFFTILILCVSISCQDTDEIPFQATESILVVEGWITDQPALQYVQLSSTVEFTSPKRSNRINDAEIILFHGSEPFIHYINQGNGIYRSPNRVQGDKGKAYSLEIRLSNGEVIRSLPERMPEVSSIDSLGFDFFSRESESDSEEDEIVYFPVAFSDDPPGQNFYRWKLYRNDTLFSKPEEIFLFSDRFIDGNTGIPQEFTNYEYHLNDEAKVEILEISQPAFEFLSELKSQKTTIGTNSAVSPAPIKGNLLYPDNPQKQVLGYFGVVSLKSREKIVE